MLLQAYDFWHLNATMGVRLQIGGADQWGNITAGLELIRKKSPGASAHAMSVPLLLDSQGRKFGKSTGGGSLWLDQSLSPPFRIHQYLLNTADDDAVRYLHIFCLWEEQKLAAIIDAQRAAPQERAAQNALADEVVRIVHGDVGVEEARRSASVLFGGSFEGISDVALREIFSDVPSSALSRAEVLGLTVVELFVRAGVAPSKGEARRLIEGGGGYINNYRIEKTGEQVSEESLGRSFLVLRAGKKRYHVVELVG
jgi:tyrosyl-tRNA synthetase